MDDTAQNTGEHDAFARLLAELKPPTTDPVEAAQRQLDSFAFAPVAAPLTPQAAVAPTATTSTAAPISTAGAASRAPELMGADELAAPPRPFPPIPVSAIPLIAPPLPPHAAVPAAAEPVHAAPAQTPSPTTAAPPPAAPASLPTSAPPPTSAPLPTASAPLDFAALLTASSEPGHPAGTSSPFGADAGAAIQPGLPDLPDIARSTVGEKLVLLFAIVIPPLGLLAALVASIRSAQRRGWVIGLLRAAIAVGIVLSVVAGIGGYIGYTMLLQQQARDRTVAASAAFCSTLKADPTVIMSPTFGWPAREATITDSLAAMQSYEDKWLKLAKVSPDGIRAGVTTVATAAKQIIESVNVGRTVDDAGNISVMTQTASASGVPGWYREYCK